MLNKIFYLLGIFLAFASSIAAQGAPESSLPPLLPDAREIELAKSAGLPAWTGDATIYVLKRGGFQIAHRGSNGFTCMVQRDQADTIEPICYDPEGTASILPRVLRETELREQGKSKAEIDRETAERFRSGQYRAPRRNGIAYMLSRENRVFNGEKVIWFPPHLMFYAPYARGADVGEAPQHLPHSPLVLNAGDPHAYIIVVVPDTMPRQAASAEHKH
jgi:hypothetical protein